MTAPHKFTDNEIEEVRRKSDLIALVSRRVALRRESTLLVGLCPFHKEKTPSFKISARTQRYTCYGCGAHGNAIDWLMQMEGMTFVQAVEALRDNWVPSGAPLVRPAYAPKPLDERDSRIEARSIWKKALPSKGTVVEEYLRGRGIKPSRSALEHVKFAPLLRFSANGQLYPAMIAQLTDNQGFCCVQRTYLDRNAPEKLKLPGGEGKNLPVKLTKGAMGPSAVRFSEPAGGTVGIAEGVETALSASQLYSLPVWATCGASRFKSIEFPPDVDSLVIFGDPGDVGRTLAFDAQDFWMQKGLAVEVIFPAAAFENAGIKDDFNDILQATS